jgi:hypothetical protein
MVSVLEQVDPAKDTVSMYWVVVSGEAYGLEIVSEESPFAGDHE